MKEIKVVIAFFIIFLCLLLFYFILKYLEIRKVKESFETKHRLTHFDKTPLEEPDTDPRVPYKFRNYELDIFQEPSATPIRNWSDIKYPNLKGGYSQLSLERFGVSLGIDYENQIPTTPCPVFSIVHPQEDTKPPRMYFIMLLLPERDQNICKVAVHLDYQTPPNTPFDADDKKVQNAHSGIVFISKLKISKGRTNYKNIKFIRNQNTLSFLEKKDGEFEIIDEINITEYENKYQFKVLNTVASKTKTNLYAGMPMGNNNSIKIHNLKLYNPDYQTSIKESFVSNTSNNNTIETFETSGGEKVKLLFPKNTDAAHWPLGRIFFYRDRTAKWITYADTLWAKGQSQATMYTTYNNTTGETIKAYMNIIADNYCTLIVKGENGYEKKHDEMQFEENTTNNKKDVSELLRTGGGWGWWSSGLYYNIEIPPGENTFEFTIHNAGTYRNPAGLLASIYKTIPHEKIQWMQGFKVYYYRGWQHKIANEDFIKEGFTNIPEPDETPINYKNPEQITNTKLHFTDDRGKKPTFMSMKRSNYVNADFRGYLHLTPGKYKFYITGDDGIVFFVGHNYRADQTGHALNFHRSRVGLTRNDNHCKRTDLSEQQRNDCRRSWWWQAPTEYVSDEITISETGYVPFSLIWFEEAGGAHIQMTHYSKDGGKKEEIPLSVFQMPSDRIGGDIEVLFNTNDETWFQKDYTDPSKKSGKKLFTDMFWRHISGSLKQADTDGNDVCGVNSDGNLYCKDKLSGSEWKLIKQNGGLKHVSISNKKMCTTNNQNQVWCKDDLNPGNNFYNVAGTFKQVDLDGNQLCGVTPNNDIYCKEDVTKNKDNAGDWKQIPGKLQHVSLSNGKIYGTNGVHDIWHKPSTSTNNDWKHIGGKLKQVDMEGNVVCGVNSSNHIYCKDNLEESNWVRVPGGLSYISVNDDTHFYGLNGSQHIFYGHLNYK